MSRIGSPGGAKQATSKFIEPRGRPHESTRWEMSGCCHLGLPSTISLAHSCLAPSRASPELRQVRNEPSGVVIHEVAKPADAFETGLISLAHLDMSELLRAAFLCEMRPTLIVRRLKLAAFFARERRDDKKPCWDRTCFHAERLTATCGNPARGSAVPE